ncbi:MAG TPA: winged helix-turn-helix transcriptional regulator [Terriglobales bacterium]|nr:winged helix-turn-helix transcriptional regulator [Terriglobales bacterium]
MTERLRGLEAEGILYRECEPTIPPAVTYGIAKRVRVRVKDIKQVLDEFNRLAQTWQQEDASRRPGSAGKSRAPRAREPHPVESLTSLPAGPRLGTARLDVT